MISLCGAGFWILFNVFIAGRLDFQSLPITHLLLFFGGVAGGAIVGIVVLRKLGPKFDEFKKSNTIRTRLERNRKTDVREIEKFLPRIQENYDPTNFFKPKGFFLGLGENGNPVYWEERLPHVQVTGTTGAGKGVALGMLCAQAIRQGAAVVYIDPKDDEWGPYVLYEAAQKVGCGYQFIDLRLQAPPQLNLFDGASAEEIEELFLAGFGLSDKGEAADFYRVADRRAAADVAFVAAIDDHTPASLYNEVKEQIEETAPYFSGLLREMAAVSAVNARGGFSLENLVEAGGAIYVVGSMRNAKVLRLQRMLLIRLIQLVERRDRAASQTLRPVLAILDEFKTQVSRPAMEALQGARDKGMAVVMAHQSMSDLRDCPADMDPESVVGGVMENGKLKLVYKVQDPETAAWMAAKSGLIQVDDELRSVRQNLALAETVDDARSIRQAERFFVDQNMVLNLPAQVAVVFGLGLPQFVQTAAVRVRKNKAAIEPVEAPGYDSLFGDNNPISLPTSTDSNQIKVLPI